LSSDYPSPRRAQILLAFGAIIGLVLAATDLLTNDIQHIDNSTAAIVNNHRILVSEHLTYLSLLANDKREPLTESDHQHVLNKMIDERLMLERGVKIGLPDSDPNVKKTIIQSMIQLAITDATGVQPDNTELQKFFDQNQKYFAKPAQLKIERMVFRNRDPELALSKARLAHQHLVDGENFSEVKHRLADKDIIQLPNSPLSPNKLQQYIGPQLTKHTLSLSSGEISEPIADGNTYNIIWLQTVHRPTPPSLASVREQLVREYQRRQGERALQDYLTQLRKQAEVVINKQYLLELTESPRSNLTKAQSQ
jgi:PPIC-type PPIASE domain